MLNILNIKERNYSQEVENKKEDVTTDNSEKIDAIEETNPPETSKPENTPSGRFYLQFKLAVFFLES